MDAAAGILTADGCGLGGFPQSVSDFVQWLQCAGQGLSAPFCPGDLRSINLESLVEEGILTKAEYDGMFPGGDASDEEYDSLYHCRWNLLTMAYERSNISLNPEFQTFVGNYGWWLEDYALFMALKAFFADQCWREWPEDIRLRYGYALDYYRRELYFDIEYQMYLQFKLYQQTGTAKITSRPG